MYLSPKEIMTGFPGQRGRCCGYLSPQCVSAGTQPAAVVKENQLRHIKLTLLTLTPETDPFLPIQNYP